MNLLLDPRQRAMLREMGVPVWQPEAPVISASMPATRSEAAAARPSVAMKSEAVSAYSQRAGGLKDSDSTAAHGLQERTAPAPLSRRPVAPISPTAAPVARAGSASLGSPVWQVGAVHTLYGAAVAPGIKTSPAHWLVLGETPAASLQAGDFDPLAGEAGALLGNMLRAARLPAAAQVQFVPLARLLPSTPGQAGLADALAPLLAGAQPDIVLLMGRLAAQAALRTDEPLGQLRGRVHRLHGIATVLTYDPAHLLRNADNKAKAWDDLCLAMRFVDELGLKPRG